MRRVLLGCAIALITAGVARAVPGDALVISPIVVPPDLYSTGMGTGTTPENPYSTVFNDYKTSPARESDVIKLDIGVHLAGLAGTTRAEWAGARFKIHWDGTEVDIDGIGLAPPFLPYGSTPKYNGLSVTTLPPRSQQNNTDTFEWTAWDPAALNSGWPGGAPHSVFIPLIRVTIHAKNTDPINNSDFDFTITGQNIYHVSTPRSSGYLEPSDWIYVPNPGAPWDPGHIDPVTNPDELGRGMWYHLDQPVHTVSQPSGFWATQIGVGARIGLEHVPEPITLGLLAGGVGMLVAGRRRRST